MGYYVAFLAGAVVGYFVAALCVAASRGSERENDHD